MLLASILIGAASIAQVSADTEANRKQQHNDETQGISARKPIQGMRKMSDDEGEKFYMDYWHFGEEQDPAVANSTDTDSQGMGAATEIDGSSTILPRSYHFQPPLSLGLGLGRFADLRASPLARRDFQCPAGTNACASINRPDSCCRADETCVVVEDTGSGDVGCCPAGQDCSGTIGSCWKGYTGCPSSLGGGCCFPGFECVEQGCAHIVTVTLTLSSTTLTTTSTETIPAQTTTTATTTISTSSTGDLSPPDRPTSLTTSTSSETEMGCPTGFYACAAVYHGGCCQTGRDCDTTSCPAIPSTTIVTDDRTIAIGEPTTSAEGSEASGPRRCASGWFSCADTVGGGCCPTGYACGSSCTAVPAASTTGTVDKVAPTVESSGERARSGWERVTGTAFMIWMML
ncbi:hypothetical protein BDW62DRAFT_192233 [Aspergillus aurantiobrunneus]